MTLILWFRRDLRLRDNPALAAVLAESGAVLPVYIRDDVDAGRWAPGGASRWWLHGSLESLAADLDRRGGRLVLRSGAAADVLAKLADETGARTVVWSRRHEPWARAQQDRVRARLGTLGVACRDFESGLLHDPARLRTGAGGPYRVFTPFWRALRGAVTPGPEHPEPNRFPAAPAVSSEALRSWRLRPTRPDWAGGLREAWSPGEAGARALLDHFLDDGLAVYSGQRNLPGVDGTSRLSPHLHFGEISAHQIWRAVIARAGDLWSPGADSFLSEIAWREFSHHLLHAFPDMPSQPLRSNFERMSWRTDAAGLQAWRQGRTGYPIVDAGLRQLWRTGWMHNRVRMIVASFLIKDLLVSWRTGADWFWDTLVDADLANNSASWQWVAGCGADAAPFFRIFNPVTQGRKFDPAGAYVRRWVPEISGLPDDLVHAPWTAGPIELAAANVTLGANYPFPVVDHGDARARALEALKGLQD